MTLNIDPIHPQELNKCGQKCRWKGWLGNQPWNPLAKMDLFFSRMSFKSMWSLPSLGYFVCNGLFCMESYLAQNAKKKKRIMLAGEQACWSSRRCTFLRSLMDRNTSKLHAYIVSTPNLSGVKDFQIFQKCWKKNWLRVKLLQVFTSFASTSSVLWVYMILRPENQFEWANLLNSHFEPYKEFLHWSSDPNLIVVFVYCWSLGGIAMSSTEVLPKRG